MQRLYLFGSATTVEFDPAKSDLVFILSSRHDADPDPWFRRHLDLQSALVKLLDRPVDPVIDQPFRNPYSARPSNRHGLSSIWLRANKCLRDILDAALLVARFTECQLIKRAHLSVGSLRGAL